MGKKANAKKFRNLVVKGKLPIVLENTIEKHLHTGITLKASGYEGKEEINDNRRYILNVPVQIQANHARRLRKAFQRNGYAGVEAYGEKVRATYDKKEDGSEQ